MRCTDCQRPVKPVVAVDIDGTLGEYHDHLLHFLDLYFGRPLPRGWDGIPDWEEYLGLSRDEYRQAKLAFRQGGTKRWMPLRRYAQEMTYTLRDAGAEVWLTTTRPYLRLDSVDPDTREWLERHKIYYDHLLYDEHKYIELGRIVGHNRVCAVIEDLPDQYLQARSLFGEEVALLVSRPHNQAFRYRFEEYEAAFLPGLETVTGATVARVDDWIQRYGHG